FRGHFRNGCRVLFVVSGRWFGETSVSAQAPAVQRTQRPQSLQAAAGHGLLGRFGPGGGGRFFLRFVLGGQVVLLFLVVVGQDRHDRAARAAAGGLFVQHRLLLLPQNGLGEDGARDFVGGGVLRLLHQGKAGTA